MDKLGVQSLQGSNGGLLSEEKAWSGRYLNCGLDSKVNNRDERFTASP